MTGLVNRLSDTNLGQVAGEVLTLLEAESRRAVADLTADLLLHVFSDLQQHGEPPIAVPASNLVIRFVLRLKCALSGKVNLPVNTS